MNTVKQRSFWSTTSGVVTGIAGTITGVVTLVTLGVQMGWVGGDDDGSSVKSEQPAVSQPAPGGPNGGAATAGGGSSGSGGAATTPAFTDEPTRLSFEPLAAREATVTVQNTGSAALTVQAPSVDGANPTQFRATAPTCTRAALAPGRTCEVEVTFAPQRPGTYTATLVIQATGARAQEITLTGTAPLG